MSATPRPRGFHHVAYACRDIRENHRFYADLMGFELVHTEINRHEGGFFRHTFYDTGDGDPNGIMVELCEDTPGIEPDPDKALALLEALPGAAPDPS